MDMGLKGKVALVTGGGRDTGALISTTLAAEGAKVAVNYRQSEADAAEVVKAITDAGGEAKAYQADVSDYAQVEAMAAAIADDWGRIDVLVNNAGYVKLGRFNDLTPADWKQTIDTCLYGAMNCCRVVGPMMVEQEYGRVVNIIGDSSRVGEANISIVATARGGTIALGKSVAREWGPSNVTVNTVSLGLVETAHSDKAFLDKYRDKIAKTYPARRIGMPEDVAPMVVFLASDHAAWITGQVISVNGGYSMV